MELVLVVYLRASSFQPEVSGSRVDSWRRHPFQERVLTSMLSREWGSKGIPRDCLGWTVRVSWNLPITQSGWVIGGKGRDSHLCYDSVSAGSAASRALKELVGALGGSVTFPLTHSINSIDSIVWTFNTTTLITIQPTTANNQDTVIVTQNHNKKRVEFSHGNYSLKLSKLNKNDSGAYHVHIYSSSLQHPFTQNYELRVYGE